MARDTLIDFFHDIARARGEFLVYDDGFRSRAYSYADVGRAARGFAARLTAAGIRQGDKVLFWSENRPEWIVAFWGCLLCGVVVVPVDYRSSPDFVARVSRIVQARVVLVGQDVPPLSNVRIEPPVWRLHEIEWTGGPVPDVMIRKDDVAEIIFTSGATAEPKGVIITHRNILANIVPVEREILKYREWGRPFFPAALPEPPAAQPHVRPGDGHLRPADAAGHRDLHARLQPGGDRRADQEPEGVGARLGAEDPRRAARARRARRARNGDAGAQAARRAPVVALPPRAPRVRHEVLELRRRRGAARARARGVLVRARLRRGAGIRVDRDRADREPEPSVRHEEGVGRQGDPRRRGEDRAGRRDPRARRERDEGLLQRRRGDGARVRGRLVPHRRHRRDRRRRPDVHPRPQEGNDRHARGAERLPRGRRARAQSPARRARLGGGRRAGGVLRQSRGARARGARRRSRRRSGRRGAAGERRARGTPEDPPRARVARARAAAHRRHAQAEARRRARLGENRRRAAARAAGLRPARGARREIRRARRSLAAKRRSTSWASARSSAWS